MPLTENCSSAAVVSGAYAMQEALGLTDLRSTAAAGGAAARQAATNAAQRAMGIRMSDPPPQPMPAGILLRT